MPRRIGSLPRCHPIAVSVMRIGPGDEKSVDRLRVAEVRGEDGARVPPGATGELWIGGPGVTRGYANRPERTAMSSKTARSASSSSSTTWFMWRRLFSWATSLAIILLYQVSGNS